MECWYCGGKVIWNSDFNYDEMFGECDNCPKPGNCDGIATVMTCSDCGAEYTITKRCDEIEKIEE